MKNQTERKHLEIKRKIINLIRNREHTASLQLFYKFFSKDNPADPEFLESFYLELNRLNMFEFGFRMLAETADWHPNNTELDELRQNSAKLYYDSLILQGNNLLFEREEKAARFSDSLRRSDSLSREKMREENEKILAGIAQKALNSFLKAYELNDESIAALSGLSRCYSILGEQEKYEEIEKLLIEKSPTQKLKEKVEELLEDDSALEDKKKQFFPKEYDIEEFNLLEVRNLFDQKKHEDLIKRVDFLHLSHRISVPMLLLKARSLAELKRFKDCDTTLFEAERQNSHFKELQLTRTDINEIKCRLLIKAAEVYLKKGLEIGPSLGKGHFERARKSLKQALDILPENIDLLDQLYTAQMYLGEEKEAFKTKALIYLINDRYITTFDKETSASLCFIAGFAFSHRPLIVDEFRWFRREFLLGNSPGRLFNALYITHSPYFLKRARRYKSGKMFCQIGLMPILWIIRLIKFIFFSGRFDKYYGQ